MVHSDALRAAAFVPRMSSRSELVTAHLNALETFVQGRDIWLPTFNYDFLRSGYFDTSADPSQVGPITEAFRTSRASWRTPTPVFSFAGGGQMPGIVVEEGQVIDPFDDSSAFAIVCSRQGSIAWYGARLESTTLLHHAERKSGRLSYRYDKLFGGSVTDKGSTTPVTLNYHVRPMGQHLDYNWPRLEREAAEAGVVRTLEPRGHARWAPAATLRDLWVEAMRRDPLALLDDETRVWVDRRLQVLGRAFVKQDFE
jgi:aminoglycoside 3-N-acetyltransferase